MNLEMQVGQEMHLDMNQLPNLMNYAKVGFNHFYWNPHSNLRRAGSLKFHVELSLNLVVSIRHIACCLRVKKCKYPKPPSLD